MLNTLSAAVTLTTSRNDKQKNISHFCNDFYLTTQKTVAAATAAAATAVVADNKCDKYCQFI